MAACKEPSRGRHLHPDHLGIPRYTTNAGGTQVWAANADAFGVGTPSGSATVNLRMPGQYYDAESGLFYNWNRYYSLTIGRYISSDPIGLEGGLNTFNYADVNPVMFIDPEGLAKVGRLYVPSGNPILMALDVMKPTPLADATCYRNGIYICSPTPSAPVVSAPTPAQACTVTNPTGTLYNKPANDNNNVIPFPSQTRPNTPRNCWEELFQCEERERMSLVPNLGRCSDEFLKCMNQ